MPPVNKHDTFPLSTTRNEQYACRRKRKVSCLFTGGISIGKYFCFPAGLVARLDAMADMPVSISIDPDNLNNTNERKMPR